MGLGMLTEQELARVVIATLCLNDGDPRELEPEDFTMTAHRIILAALTELKRRGDPTLLSLIPSATKEPPSLWMDELMRLTGYATTAPNLPAHIAAMRRERHARELRDGTKAAYDKLSEGDQDEGMRMIQVLARDDARNSNPTSVGEALGQLFTRGVSPSVPLGIRDLESRLSVSRGHMCVIGARPGVGKSALLTTIALSAARSGWNTLFLSLEMEARETYQRLLADFSRTSLANVVNADSPELVAKAGELSRLPLMVDDKLGPKLAMICAYVESYFKGAANGLVLLDYLQLVKPTGRYQNRVEQVGEVCRELKGMARRAGIVLVCGAQLNRAIEERRNEEPILSDLRESGEIEQVADQVILLSRNGDDAKLRVAKNRHGEKFVAHARFVGHQCRFEDAGPAPEPWQP